MRKYILFFFVSVIFYSLHFYLTRHGIYGDGNGYYSLAHTLFFQHSLNFTPIYKYLSAFQGSKYVFSRIFWNTAPTSTGVLNCPWLIGTSLFWLPGLAIMWFVTLPPFFHVGMFSFVFEFACGLSGISFFLAGIYMIERIAGEKFGKDMASKLVLLVFFGSQLFYYAAFEPALSHQVSFFLIASILYLTTRHNITVAGSGLLGLAIGLLAITRMGELILVVLPVTGYWFHILRKYGRKAVRLFPIFVIAFCIGILPQVLLQKGMYGSIWHNPYLQAEKGVFHPVTPLAIWNHMFTPGGGFLLWSPLFMLAVAGFFTNKDKGVPAYMYIYGVSLLIYSIFIASWEFVPPAGFGNRFFISAIPFLVFGLAHFFARYRHTLKYIGIIVIVWNMMLVAQFFLDSDRMVKRHGLTTVNFLTGQVTVPLRKAGLLQF